VALHGDIKVGRYIDPCGGNLLLSAQTTWLFKTGPLDQAVNTSLQVSASYRLVPPCYRGSECPARRVPEASVLHMFDIATAIADFPRGGAALISTLRCAPGRRRQRDLANQFVYDGLAKGFKILRHYDESAGAADDIAFVIFG
jgi:hypothetical protein